MKTRFFLSVGLLLVAVNGPGCASVVDERGLVGHWTFDALSNDGKRVPDASGHEHHARTYGQPLVDGVLGKAIRMEAFPEQVIDLENLRFRAPCTVAFWVWTRDLFHDRRILSQTGVPDGQNGALRFDGGQLEVLSDSEWQPLIRDGLRLTRWMHVAVVYDSDGAATGYLNAQRGYSVPCNADFSGSPVAIGAPFLGREGNVFSGRLDDFRIYNRVLGEAEIVKLANTADVEHLKAN